MPKEKAPAFQAYAGDFINDINVRSMTLDEVGMYWLLLCHAWIEDGLPDDDETIEALCFSSRQATVGRPFDEIWKRVKPRFELSDGRLRNKRQEVIRAKMQKFREQRSIAGQTSAAVRAAKEDNSNEPPAPTDLPDEAIALASDLRDIIMAYKKNKIDKRMVPQWAKIIDLLKRIDGIVFSRQHTVMNWYRKHVGGMYVPIVYCGTAWRTKFLKMEDAMKNGVDDQGNRYTEVGVDEYQTQIDDELPLGEG